MITQALSKFISETDYRAIPASAVAAAKKAILDYFGVTLAGSTETTGKLVTRFVKEAGGTPDAGVIGGGFRTSPFLAALANGTIGHALDFDDECESWKSHPTVAILPAVLALGEKSKASGKDILAAYIIGWEVAARIGSTIYSEIMEGGWHATSCVGTLAATAAGARVLKLGTEQTKMALGIGASGAGGLRVNHGTDTKPLHAGLAASNGVRAAHLAGIGFTAVANILENPAGYVKTLAGKELAPSALVGLGTSFDIEKSLCIKAHPCNYTNQRPAQSVLYLIKKHNIRASDVNEVQVKLTLLQADVNAYHQPKSALEAKFSIEYCIAGALVYGQSGLAEFTENKVRNPEVQALYPKIKAVLIEGTGWRDYTHCGPGQLVTIRLKNGVEYSYDSQCPKGHASNPMSWDEVAAKFMTCAEHVLSRDNIAHCVELVERLQEIEDVAELTSILAGVGG